MFPFLIDLGVHDLPLLGSTHLALPTYGALFALGTVLAWIWFMRRARVLDYPDDFLFNVTFYSLLASIFGAKLTLILVEWRDYIANPMQILGTLRVAGVLMGGVAAGTIVLVLYCRKHGRRVWPLADAGAAPIALAQAVGRLGCFSAGCCYGVKADAFPLAVTFTNPDAYAQTGVPLNVPLVPVQLIQMACDLVLALILTLMYRRRSLPTGTIFWTYILLYGAGRFMVEFLRDDPRGGLWLFSTSQYLSVASVIAASIMIARLRSRSVAEPS